MLISREKRKSNIAEYILYMWQVEDTVRALGFDIDRIDSEIIQRYDQSKEVKKEMREWYENILLHMKREKIENSGHVQFLRNTVNNLYKYHLSLLSHPEETDYKQLYTTLIPLIGEMNQKQRWSCENEIEVCLNAVYVFMMIRLKGEPVTPETEKAIKMFIDLLANLSAKFKVNEESE